MRSCLILFGLLIALTGVVHGVELKVALGVQEMKIPRSSLEAGKGVPRSTGLAGFNEALAREICRRISARCVTVHSTFGEILPGVESGRFDLGFGNFLRTPEREKRVAFSDAIWRSSSRLLTTPQAAARMASRAPGEVTLDSLQGVRVAVVDGTQQHAYLRSIASERRLTVIPLPTMADALLALKEDRADLALLLTLATYAMISREPSGRFEFVGPPVADRGLGGTVHIALPKQKEDVLSQVNQAINALRADGSYQRIARQFFPFSMD